MSARRQQLRFVRDFVRERARMRWGALVRRDPLCLLHFEQGREDPYPLYERMRRRGPVTWSTAGLWVTPDHRVCRAVLRDRRFGAAGAPDDEVSAPVASPDLSLLDLNPPDHTRLRRLVLPAFSPKAVADFAPKITETTDRHLDRVRAGETFDLIETLAAPLPIAVITDLLGVPDAEAAEFAAYGTTFGSALGGLQSLAHAARLFQAQRRLSELFTELFEVRRREPGDDVISRLVSAGPEQITPEEMVPLCTLLLLAGFETTVNLIGNTALALLQRPGHWRRVASQPTLAERAVDETLRYDPPVQRTARVALEDVGIAGTVVRKGEVILIMIGGANRDPEVFADPDRFDLAREERDHLAFSAGIHYCVGAPLARLEAAIAIRRLAVRFPDLRLDGRLERRPGSLIRGLAHMPVVSAMARPGRLTA